MDPLLNLDLTALSERLRPGTRDAADLLRCQWAHIDDHDTMLRCFVHRDPPPAAPGPAAGPLGGVPLAYKDIFAFNGRGPAAGARTLPPASDEQATVLCRLQAAGATLLGALNLDEFAAGGSGVNQHFGRCRNPWQPEHITGGSSAGSAAAVAARFCFGALGSDAGGSIRLPAALCGVVGLKPTYGLVSRHGAMARTWSMDCIGPLARSAADCALLLEAIAGADPLDASSVDTAGRRYDPRRSGRLDLRIGIARECAGPGFDPTMVRAFEQAQAVLGRAGAALAPASLGDIDRLNDLQQVIVKCEGAALLGPLLRRHAAEISPAAHSVLQEGFVIPATRYLEALAIRGRELTRFTAQVFTDCDLVMAPVTAGGAPRADALPGSNTGALDAWFSAAARFTRFANYLGIPAISVPCGFDARGLPLAFQLIGPPFSEPALLRAAHAFQQATDFHTTVPPALLGQAVSRGHRLAVNRNGAGS